MKVILATGSDLKFLSWLVVSVEEKEQVVTGNLPRFVTRNGSMYLSVFACYPRLGEKDMTGRADGRRPSTPLRPPTPSHCTVRHP